MRWAFVGFSLCEASGLMGLVMGFVIMGMELRWSRRFELNVVKGNDNYSY